jgi:N-acetylglutamate synthase
MQIYPMTITDYEKVFQLWESVPEIRTDPVNDSKAGITKYLLRNPDTSFIAKENEDVVGAILAGHDGRKGILHHTAVAEGYRDKGIGAALVESVLNAYREMHINKAAFTMLEGNDDAEFFWRKMGFSIGEYEESWSVRL